MAEFIEFLSPQALAELEKANADLLTMVANVNKVGQATKNITTPSAGKGAIQDLTEQYKKQEQTIIGLQKQLTELAKVRTYNNQKTSEEIVNQRALRTNADRQAQSTSNLVGAYKNLSAQVAIASERYQNLIVRGRLASQSQAQYNAELRKAQQEFRTLQTRVLAADKAVDKWGRTNERSIAFGRDLMSAFGIVGGVTAFALITKDIFEQTKQIQALDNALKLVTGTQENFYSQQAFINRISEQYGVSVNDLTKQFTQFYVSAKDKLAGEEIQNIFESITKAGAAMGLSVESQQRAFLALNQMMSKGTIQAEELRGQLGEALPGAFGIMAKAVGVTEKELAKMMKDGDLLASEVLPKFAKQLEIAYGIENVTRIETLTSAQNRLSNSWTAFVRELNEGNGVVTKFFRNTIELMSELLKGTTLIFESFASERKRILKELDNKAYEEYLKGVDQLTKDELENTKKYNSEKIADNAKTIAELTQQNKDYAKDATLGGAKRYELTQANIVQIQELNNLTSRLKGENRAINDIIKDRNKAEADAIKKAEEEKKKKKTLTKEQIEANKKALELENKNRFELNISNLEREKFLLQQRLKQDEVYGQEKVDLENKIAGFEIAILSEKFREALRLSKGNVDAQKKLANEYITDIEKIGGFKSIFQKPEISTDSENPETPLIDEKDATDSMDWLKQYREEVKLTDEETQRLKDATDEFVKSFAQGFFDNAGLSTVFEVLDGRLDEFGDNWKAKTLLISEAMQEMYNFIAELSQANFDQEREQLKQETEIAIAFAGDSQSAQDEINRQAEEKRKEIDRREFKAKQQQAKANIIIDTAQAIIGLWANPGFPAAIPLAIIVGALGAAQLAVVSSQQAPAYKDGTQNHKGGLMLVNDGNGSNFAETIQTPDGNIYQPTERNVFMNAPKGTKVFTHDQWQKNLDSILMSNEINYAQPNVVVNSGMSDAQVDRIVSSINNKSEAHLNIDKNGFNVKIRNGHTTKEILNNQVTFGR